MNIALVTLNSKFIHSGLSTWCLKAGVDAFCKSKHNCRVFEATVNSQPDDLIRKLIDFMPDIIAFSCYIWNTSKIFDICSILSKNINCRIVLGGPEAEYRQEEILRNFSFVDYICSGEGEWSFSSLIDALSGDKEISDSEGVSYRACENIVTIPARKISDTPPSPYCLEYFDSLQGRIAYIEASRGCPYRCSYCLSGRLNTVRYFDFQSVCKNILALSESGTKTVKFIDRTFNANGAKANRILRFILENFSDKAEELCFHFEIAADILTDETVEILSEMPVGLCQLEIGIQSFNEKTLEGVNRKSDLKKLYENIKRLVALKNMHIHIDLIAGLPFEDINSFENSFNNAYSLKASMLQLGFLKMLHGSEIRENADEYEAEFSTEAPYEIRSNKWLSHDDILHLKCCEDALDRMYNSSRFLITINYLLNETGWTPFELFLRFGESADFTGISLSDFSERIYTFFSEYADKQKLREAILCDLNCLDVNIHIPDCLKAYDKNYKTIKKHFTEKLQKNIRIVLLASESKVFLSHPDRKNKITGRLDYEYCSY